MPLEAWNALLNAREVDRRYTPSTGYTHMKVMHIGYEVPLFCDLSLDFVRIDVA